MSSLHCFSVSSLKDFPIVATIRAYSSSFPFSHRLLNPPLRKVIFPTHTSSSFGLISILWAFLLSQLPIFFVRFVNTGIFFLHDPDLRFWFWGMVDLPLSLDFLERSFGGDPLFFRKLYHPGTGVSFPERSSFLGPGRDPSSCCFLLV